jgi:hypothetical protein
VRRASATLLLAIFSFMLISPTLALADGDAKLPPCCRRVGKHHCTMMASDALSGLALQPSRCASYPTTNVVPLNRLVTTPAIAQLSFAAPATRRAIQARTQSLFRSSFSRSRQKRGPPLLFS